MPFYFLFWLKLHNIQNLKKSIAALLHLNIPHSISRQDKMEDSFKKSEKGILR